MTECAAVDPTRRALEVVQQRHRGKLGGAGHAAGGERSGSEVPERCPGDEFSTDGAHQLMNDGIRLHFPESVHTDTPRCADLGEVIAHQVDNHDVLCAFLLALHEFGSEPTVFLRCAPPRPGALDRTRADPPPIRVQEEFWARTQQRPVPDTNETAVVSGGRLSQPEVGVHCAVLASDGEARSQTELVGIPCTDRLSASLDERGIGVRFVASLGHQCGRSRFLASTGCSGEQ